ncbi:hypothetical protein RBI14_13410, partial [Alcaligenaceae bacterium B3P038]|nr:hypothetical protein [Alcaligenaceae bacterium B3P038]
HRQAFIPKTPLEQSSGVLPLGNRNAHQRLHPSGRTPVIGLPVIGLLLNPESAQADRRGFAPPLRDGAERYDAGLLTNSYIG